MDFLVVTAARQYLRFLLFWLVAILSNKIIAARVGWFLLHCSYRKVQQLHNRLYHYIICIKEVLYHGTFVHTARNDRELAGRAELKLLGASIVSLPYVSGLRDLASSAMAMSGRFTKAIRAGVDENCRQNGGDFSIFWNIQRVCCLLCL